LVRVALTHLGYDLSSVFRVGALTLRQLMIAGGLRTTSVILGKTRASLYRVCRSTTGFHRPLPDLLDVVHATPFCP
jgi:hypothetical protein